ncbi:MAG: cupin domain-containing protein [Desulfobulbaceae bacterium]|nr:MAG: cupin domain-containing protein [Desulfobulbaceae bacterium]
MKKELLILVILMAMALVTPVAQARASMEPGAARVQGLINYSDSAFSKKVIFQGPGYTVLLFAFQQGQQLKPHTIDVDAFVHILEGTATVVIDGGKQQVTAGEMIILPKGLSHALSAPQDFKMLLVK